MNRLFTPTFGPTDWRRLLGDPDKHWVRGKSAFECAVSWEQASRTVRGLPQRFEATLDSNDLTRGASLLLGIPEHKVAIEGGGHSSQNDLWALLRLQNGVASMAVEAKSGESFDKLVADWLRDTTINSRKPQRLDALKKTLGIGESNLDGIRYQLLHRTASPLLEAARFNASLAIMIVQSFGGEADEDGYKDFAKFCSLMECESVRNVVSLSKRKTAVPLLLGWVDCGKASDTQVADAI
jgi:hypothetical protein